MSDNGKILAALLGGLALGAVIGLLIAPDKGSETRRKIADAAKDFAGNVEQKIKDKMKSSSNGHASNVDDEINEFTA